MDWLQMIDDEAGRMMRGIVVAMAVAIVAMKRRLVMAAIRYRMQHATVQQIVWLAEGLGVDPCDVLRLHPAMRGFCEDGQGVEVQREGELLEIVDRDLPLTA